MELENLSGCCHQKITGTTSSIGEPIPLHASQRQERTCERIANPMCRSLLVFSILCVYQFVKAKSPAYVFFFSCQMYQTQKMSDTLISPGIYPGKGPGQIDHFPVTEHGVLLPGMTSCVSSWGTSISRSCFYCISLKAFPNLPSQNHTSVLSSWSTVLFIICLLERWTCLNMPLRMHWDRSRYGTFPLSVRAKYWARLSCRWQCPNIA